MEREDNYYRVEEQSEFLRVRVGDLGWPKYNLENPYLLTHSLELKGEDRLVSTRVGFWNNLYSGIMTDPYCKNCFNYWQNPLIYLGKRVVAVRTSVFQVASSVWESLVVKLGEFPVLLKNGGEYRSGITILDGIPRIVSPLIIGQDQTGRPIFSHKEILPEFGQGVLVGDLAIGLNSFAYWLLRRRLEDEENK